MNQVGVFFLSSLSKWTGLDLQAVRLLTKRRKMGKLGKMLWYWLQPIALGHH
jgi:hypothetical protein